MKKVILIIDEAGNLVDEKGSYIYHSFADGNFVWKEFNEGDSEVGIKIKDFLDRNYTADDLVKLRASGVI